MQMVCIFTSDSYSTMRAQTLRKTTESRFASGSLKRLGVRAETQRGVPSRGWIGLVLLTRAGMPHDCPRGTYMCVPASLQLNTATARGKMVVYWPSCDIGSENKKESICHPVRGNAGSMVTTVVACETKWNTFLFDQYNLGILCQAVTQLPQVVLSCAHVDVVS